METHCAAAGCRGTCIYLVLLPYIEQSNIEDTYDYEQPRAGWHDWYIFDPVGKVLGRKRLPFYQCPSDDRSSQYCWIKDFFAVVGGKTRTARSYAGDVYTDGLFAVNRWCTFADIRDGASNTFAFGESVHGARRGNGHTIIGQGAPSWVDGCVCSRPSCAPSTQELGRGYRSTKYPINSSLLPITLSEENEAPFGSFHSGGTHFNFADGHVIFINDTIDMNVYQSLSTIAGGEMIPGSAY